MWGSQHILIYYDGGTEIHHKMTDLELYQYVQARRNYQELEKKERVFAEGWRKE